MTIYDLLSNTSYEFDFIEIRKWEPGRPAYSCDILDTFRHADEAIDAYGNSLLVDWRPTAKRDDFDGTIDEGLAVYIEGE